MNIHSLSRNLALCIAPLTLLTGTCPAALVWEAGFSSYDTSGGAVALTTNSTGDDDTFTEITVSQTGAHTFTANVSDTSVPSLMTGNALKLTLTNTSGASESNTTIRLLQYNLPSLGTSGVYVLSYDIAQAAGSTNISSVNGDARTNTGSRNGSGSASSFMSALSQGTTLRYTLVINRSGAAITLPGTLGTVAADAAVAYLYDGSTYSATATITGITSTSITGFATGDNRSGSIAAGGNLTAWYDNFGVWDSASDTLNGTSVLSLTPGTVVPEPSTVALLAAGLGGGVLAALRRRRA